MEEHDDQSFEFLNLRFLLAAFAAVAMLSFVSGAVFGADKTPQTPQTPRAEERWDKVAEVMRDNAMETRK